MGAELERAQNFWDWFGNSAVTDESGEPKLVYHGAKRSDRIGKSFQKKRATSGPMSFFTENPKLASSYSTSKQDTSVLANEDYNHYKRWFKYREDKRQAPYDITQAWWVISPDEKLKLMERLPSVIDAEEDLEDYNLKHGGSQIENFQGEEGVKKAKERLAKGEKYQYVPRAHALTNWDWYIKQSRGNLLDTAVELWLNGGNLYNRENEFMDVLKEAGLDMKNVKYDSPHHESPGVFPVYLSIREPLITSNIPYYVMEALEKRSRRQRPSKMRSGGDMWDKRDQEPKEWIKNLKNDLRMGKLSSHAWTSIPDWVTDELKKLGYDGIRDESGKGGGAVYDVWIPFEPHQIKSPYNRGTFDPKKKDILSTTTLPQYGGLLACPPKSQFSQNFAGTLIGNDYARKDETKRNVATQAEVDQGREAELLLSNPTYQSAWSDLRDDLTRDWRKSPPGDQDARERCYVAITLLDKLQDKFGEYMNAGRLASDVFDKERR